MEQSVTDPQTSEETEINAEHIQQVVKDLFGTMLSIDFTSLGTPDDVIIRDEMLEASVNIDGDWNARLRVFASQELAEIIAAAMFGMEIPELTDEETRDAVGEVANVIGGNIKGIADRDCSLSLPSVQSAVEEVAEGALRELFLCAGSHLQVVLETN